MNSLLIELEPSEKLYLELVEPLKLQNFINEIKNYITGLHVYIKETYYFMDLKEEEDTNFENIEFPSDCRLIIVNRDKKSKFMVNINANIKDIDTIDGKNKTEKCVIKEQKILNMPYEKQLLFIKNINKIKKKDFTEHNQLILTIIEECGIKSENDNISFQFIFMDGRELLQLFHYQMFIILKKFIERLVIGHKDFQNSHYTIDIMVFVNDMDKNELGSAMIYKYLKNEKTNSILPSKAIMNINNKFLSKDKNNYFRHYFMR